MLTLYNMNCMNYVYHHYFITCFFSCSLLANQYIYSSFILLFPEHSGCLKDTRNIFLVGVEEMTCG